ncbi:MAG: DUF488 family protein, N3 subclade, partial [Gemmatimonadaceae bacterium]
MHRIVRIVRLGTARAPNERVRIGIVRRPPRGVPKAEFAKQNWCRVGGGALGNPNADLRPPLKLHVRICRMQLSRRCMTRRDR